MSLSDKTLAVLWCTAALLAVVAGPLIWISLL